MVLHNGMSAVGLLVVLSVRLFWFAHDHNLGGWTNYVGNDTVLESCHEVKQITHLIWV